MRSTDMRRGDRVRRSSGERGVVRSVTSEIILVEWQDGKVRGYDLVRNDLHRIYTPAIQQKELSV